MGSGLRPIGGFFLDGPLSIHEKIQNARAQLPLIVGALFLLFDKVKYLGQILDRKLT